MPSVVVGPPDERGTPRNEAERLRKERESFIDGASSAATAGLPPDWLVSGASGAGAGFLFGPIGGLIGLTIGAILSRKRRAGIMAQAAADTDTGQSMLGSVKDQLGIAFKNARTDQDRAEIGLRQKQLEAIAPLLSHPNPEARLSGMQALLNMSPDLAGELDEFEAAQLGREEVELERAQTLFTQYEQVSDDFRNDNRLFETERDAFNKLQTSFRAASPAGDIAGIFSFMKQIDPGSTVREGEFATVENSGGVDERSRALYNKLLTGERLTENQRSDFRNRSTDLYKVSLERYLDQESRFITEARLLGASDELIDTAKIGYTVPRQKTTVSDPTDVASNILVTDPEIPGAPSPGRRVIEPSLFSRGLRQLAIEGVELTEEIGRLGRGEVVIQEGDRFFVEDENGNFVREIEPPNEALPSNPALAPPSPGFLEERRLQRRNSARGRIIRRPTN